MITRISIGFLLIVCISFASIAQPVIKVSGIVTNEQNLPLQNVSVSIVGTDHSVLTDQLGEYVLYSQSINFTVKYNLLGYIPVYFTVAEKKAGRITHHVRLKVSINELEQVSITNRQEQLSNAVTLNIGDIRSIPSASGNFETLLKTLPGVSVNNELSAQYSVRGGNFDENLLYLNEIEVSRPGYFRNGQQEGLSIINSDLVSRAKFAVGGFESKFGNKLSSVLDVTYGKPDTSETIASAGLLGATIAIKQPHQSGFLLFGVRYKNTRSLLGKQDVRGSYHSDFGDAQILYQFKITPVVNMEVMGLANGGRFRLIPESRDSDFGTVSTNLHLNIDFEGAEKTGYFSTGAAISTIFNPKSNFSLKWMNSFFTSEENEDASVLGAYYLDEVDISKPNLGNRSIGEYIFFADNFLRSNNFASDLRANQNAGRHVISWGFRFQNSHFFEHLDELSQMNKINPTGPPNLTVDYKIAALNRFSANYISAYLQDSYSIGTHTELQFGVRTSFNSINHDVNVSPRMLLAYRPNPDNKIFRFSAGVYYQDPDYKTIKNLDGTLNTLQKPQRSYNLTAGYDYAFNALGTRLKFSSELYFKYADRMIPYYIDNLKLRYFSNSTARGSAYGADFNLGGEFVKDLVSYFRLSLLKANQEILHDGSTTIPISKYSGMLKRPTDQRVNFSMFFQDKLLTSPSYKVHLTLMYGSRLPVGAPNFYQYSDNFRIPAYKRVDIGFSKDFLDETKSHRSVFLNQRFSSFIAYFEIFNLLNNNNTTSYLWVKDVNGSQYAIPNYLTGRQFNFKLIAKFKGK